MKVVVWTFEPDGELWNITGVEGTMTRLGHGDTWIQLNMLDGRKRIIPLSNIAKIEIVNEYAEFIEKNKKQEVKKE